MSTQGYILRYYLPVLPLFDAEYSELRFLQLLDFCKSNEVDAVMFYVALDPNWYYMPDSVEECRKQRDFMLPYIKRLREAGIGYQLNFQNLLGSVPGGADFSKKFGWGELVDQKGRVASGCACPIDKHFRAQSGERLAIWAQTHPDVIWIDDDLRMHNHGTPMLAARDGVPRYRDHYCFCDQHIKLFCERENARFTREEIVKAVLQSGVPHTLRTRYLDFLGETVAETAAWIHTTIKTISPETRIAQMTSKPDTHAAEGRDWCTFLGALCGKDTPMIRAHFGPYQEGDPRDFVGCYATLAQTIAQIKVPAKYCPEVENTRFTVWSKSRAATALQLSLSAFMGCRDITLSLYDLDGGALEDEPAYAHMLREEKERLDRIHALSPAHSQLLGVVIPTDPDSAKHYRLQDGEDFSHLGGKGRTVEKYLLKMGVPCKYLQPDQIDPAHDVVALDTYSAGFLSDSDIKRLLVGKLFLDGGAAAVLLARGYGKEIGVCCMEKQNAFANVEQLHTLFRKDGTLIRVPLRTPPRAWYNVTYGEEVEHLSTLYDPLGNSFAGLSLIRNNCGGTVAVYPLDKSYGDGFFTHHRATLLKNLFQTLSPDMPRVDCHTFMLTVVRQSEDGTRYYFVANLGADEAQEIYLDGTRVACALPLFGAAVFSKENGELTQIV